jgi:hypothetical protein
VYLHYSFSSGDRRNKKCFQPTILVCVGTTFFYFIFITIVINSAENVVFCPARDWEILNYIK